MRELVGMGIGRGSAGLLLGPSEEGPATRWSPPEEARWVSFNYQFFDNPGYNRGRGLVSIYGWRVHVEF
jgi:hypothetical protein